MKIPENNRWQQTNNGDILGVLNESRNINLDKSGKITLSRPTIAHMTSDTDADFESVLAILNFSSSQIIVTDGEVFEGDIDGGGFSAIASSPNLAVGSDGIIYNNLLVVTDSTTVDTWDGASTWATSVITGLTGSVMHPLAIFESKPTYNLAIGNANQVRVYNSSYTEDSTNRLTLPVRYEVTSLAYRSGWLYVATKEINGGEAKIFMWNGDGTNAQYSIPVGAAWVFDIAEYKSSVVAVTNTGELLQVVGTSVQRLAAFPVFYEQAAQWFIASSAVQGRVLNNGIGVIGDRVYINIQGDVDSGYVPGMHSGLWCFDPEVGLYHTASATTNEVVADNGLSLSSNELTTSTAHNLQTGDSVSFSGLSALSGVSTNVDYYAVVTGTTTLKLAGNRYDAAQGNVITLSGTPGASDVLTYAPRTDYGELLNGGFGAVGVISYKSSVTVPPRYSTAVLFGAEPKNISNTQKSVLCGFTDSYNIGWFTTQKIYTPNVTQTWKSVYTFLSGILSSNEKGIVKYKTKDRVGIPTRDVSGTWATTTKFVTSDQAIRNNVQKGDEIMIVSGYGQGRLAHVVETPSINTSTTELVIDEALGNVSSVSSIVVTGFKKAGEISPTRTNNGFDRATVDGKSNWIQVKVELRGFAPEVAMLELTNSSDKSAV